MTRPRAVARMPKELEQLVRKYRSRLPLTIGLICAALLLVVGVVMVIPGDALDVGEPVMGGFSIAVACWIGGNVWIGGVWLTPECIVVRHTFRRTTIRWDAVGSFQVTPVPGKPPWRTVLVELRPRGHCYLTTLAGSGRYIERIIAEFEEYRAQLDAGLDVSPESRVSKD